MPALRRRCRSRAAAITPRRSASIRAIVTALYRRERTGKGSYVTTSLIAEGVWACGVSVQAALCDATFFPLHDRKNPPNPRMNVYRTSDDSWFLLVLAVPRWPALAKAIGRGGPRCGCAIRRSGEAGRELRAR